MKGLQLVDHQWRYVYLNDAAAAHSRRTKEELLGRTMMDCYPGIERTAMFEQLQKCMAVRCPAALENDFTYSDGSSRTFELRIRPAYVGLVVLSIDVTDNRRTEGQLRHVQKMEAVGRLAGGIAHDFNNILSVILGYADVLLSNAGPSDPAAHELKEIKRAGERAADLTRRLLTFSRRQTMDRQVLDLSATVLGMQRMLELLVGASVELTIASDSGACRVYADPTEMGQVIMNLAANARDAMPKWRTSHHPDDHRHAGRSVRSSTLRSRAR